MQKWTVLPCHRGTVCKLAHVQRAEIPKCFLKLKSLCWFMLRVTPTFFWFVPIPTQMVLRFPYMLFFDGFSIEMESTTQMHYTSVLICLQTFKDILYKILKVLSIVDFCRYKGFLSFTVWLPHILQQSKIPPPKCYQKDRSLQGTV